MNKLGYSVIYGYGGYFNAIYNSIGNIEVLTARTLAVDTVALYKHTYNINSNSYENINTIFYNDSPNIRYGSEWINVKDLYVGENGQVYLIAAGNANFDFSRLISYTSFSSSNFTWLANLSSPAIINKISIFGERLFVVSNGLFEFEASSGSLLKSVATNAQPNDIDFNSEYGYIVPTGRYWQSTQTTVENLLPSGVINDGFGTAGVYKNDFAKNNYEYARNVKIDPDGDFYAVSILGTSSLAASQRIGIIKLDSHGAVYTNYGSNGVAYGSYYKSVGSTEIAILDDGSILIAYFADSRYLIVSKFLENGRIDTHFASGGSFIFDFPNPLGYPVGFDESNKIDILSKPDSFTVVAGAYDLTVILDIDKNGLPNLNFGDSQNTSNTDIAAPLVAEANILSNQSHGIEGFTLELKFNENVQQGGGDITIKSLDEIVMEKYSPTSPNISIANEKVVIVLPDNLRFNTEYKLEFAAGSIQDMGGNDYVSLPYYFHTNYSPTTENLIISTNEDAAFTGIFSGADLDGNSLTFVKVSDPANGAVTINAASGAYTYTPNANYNGNDSFTFKVNDGTVDSAAATVSITVAVVNDAPVATVATVTTDEDTPATGTLAGTDVDGNPLTFAKVGDPSHGTVSINATTGAYTYTPAGNYNGSDSFTFKVNDGTVDSAIATVAVTVNPSTDISGYFYHWKNHSLIEGVKISNGVTTATTDILGNFQIEASNQLAEILTPANAITNIGNAITSADALAALKIAVGRNPNADGSAVSPYQFIAADVNQDGKVTSADALAILKMAVKRADAPAKEWLFVDESQDFWNETTSSFTTTRSSVAWSKVLNVNTQADVNVNLVAVLKGDVNGNWAAPANAPNLGTDNPTYFEDLSAKLGYPVSQWGVVL